MLTRNDLIGFKPKTRLVTLPDGQEVTIREMSAGDRDWLQFVILKHQTQRFRAALLALSLADESGTLLFDPRADLDLVADLPNSLAEPIVDAAVALNGMSEEDREAAGKDSESQLLSG